MENSLTPVPVVQDSNSAKALYAQIEAECLEMGQLKSQFDIEQFTINSQGPFPAHQYHFLMRQYSLALLELRRLYNDRERLTERRRMWQCGLLAADFEKSLFPSNEIEECDIQIAMLDLSIVNKRSMCEHFEKCRRALVEQHGKEFTNEEYQAEEPSYWLSQFNNMARSYQLQQMTGVPEGVWKSIAMANAEPLLTKEYRLGLPVKAKEVIDQTTPQLEVK